MGRPSCRHSDFGAAEWREENVNQHAAHASDRDAASHLRPASFRRVALGVRAGLIVRRTTTAGGYAFKHDLTQEVAYHSELRDRRARIHRAVARALEQQHPDERDDLAALISHHLEQAGQNAPGARSARLSDAGT